MPPIGTEMPPEQLRQTLDRVRGELLSERAPEGHWVGRLAPSALSTATAVSAIASTRLAAREAARAGGDAAGRDPDDDRWRRLVARGMAYLQTQQLDDGGFGDTDRSRPNVATSYLALAASTLAERVDGKGLPHDRRERLENYLHRAGGIPALRARYGKDQTFVVPILTNLAIAALADWDDVPRLPFEAAVFPQSMYRLLRMPVVSYAIPALVAIGQARHFLGKPAIWPIRLVRRAAIGRTMRVLRRMQPDSGGYLEATPLTSFVVMSLAATGRGDCEVAREGLRFLEASMSPDGSWPIDTNLATWVTSLAIGALAADPEDDRGWCDERLVRWHLGCQHRRRHPFTGAEPGGWGWTDLSGAVPDSDDTPAAMLALRICRPHVGPGLAAEIDRAIRQGTAWLRALQNRDGGWPTFCRGWGKLPFDRSSTDLTAHAIRALSPTDPLSPTDDASPTDVSPTDASPTDASPTGSGPAAFPAGSGANQAAVRRGLRFLHRQQQPDGCWLPLWFGNQDRPDESNPIYGTARVLLAGRERLGEPATGRGVGYLLRAQNPDGGWGGGPSVAPWMRREPGVSRPAGQDGDGDGEDAVLISTVEETALVVEALADFLASETGDPRPGEDAPSGGDPNAKKRKTSPDFATNSGNDENEAVWAAIIRGVEFLLRAVDDGRHRVPWPIGFYFAKLWYHERLYPLIFTVAALGRVWRLRHSARPRVAP